MIVCFVGKADAARDAANAPRGGKKRPTATPAMTPQPTMTATPQPTTTPQATTTPIRTATASRTATRTPIRTATPLQPTATPVLPTPTPGPCSILPPDNAWNTDVSGYPVHPSSATYVSFIGAGKTLHPDFGTFWLGAPIGFPWVIVPGDQPLVPVDFLYDTESDPGPYPIPIGAPFGIGYGPGSLSVS